jgi:hypothetical protein
MKDKLLAHFHKIGARRFVVGTVIILVVLDILNCVYLKLAWVQNDLSQRMVLQIINQMKLQPADFNPTTMLEIRGLVDKSFDFFMFIILINNLFFYFFYLRKKLWAQGYVLFYTLTAAIFSGTLLFDGYGMGSGWLIFNLMTIPFYVYLYMGVKLLKDETTLVPQKKAR